MSGGEVGIGIVGYGMMGKAHSYGYTVAPLMRNLPYRPRLRVISGRDETKVAAAAAACEWWRENLTDPLMADELIGYFSGLHDRLSTRIVILRGNGRAFCAGAELGSEAFAAPGDGRPQRHALG